MADDRVIEAIGLYREAIEETARLYRFAAEKMLDAYRGSAPQDAEAVTTQLHDLHQGLLMKVYAAVVSPGEISTEQRQLGRVLLAHLWQRPVLGGDLDAALRWLSEAAAPFGWPDLVRPFLEIPVLRDSFGRLDTAVMRMANVIARSDGSYSERETTRLRTLQQTLDELADATPPPRTLPPRAKVLDAPPAAGQTDSRPTAEQSDAASPRPSMRESLQWLRAEAARLEATAASMRPSDSEGNDPFPPHETRSSSISDEKIAIDPPRTPDDESPEPLDPRTPEERLADARAQLDRLIGLDNIKHQIETLTNFLRMEKLREAEGLPTSRPSLHMAFVGNPGTGKTTVARIVADIYGGLGVLERGHLIETDRSGLVAEYAGQTGPKTNAKIDEALDGVLFIDEAYTLIDSSGQDQYGREAVQTLLKRMEDQRDRLVVILAGYPVEMEMMIRSNPGLSSRVGTTLQFDDYAPGDLARIFGLMAGKAEYVLPNETRRRVLAGFDYLYQRRDRHFGNGRTVRNSFERSVRRLANRLATISQIDRQLLTTLEPEDIEIAGLETSLLSALVAEPRHVRVDCQHCEQEITITDTQLGSELPCPACQQTCLPQWGDPVVVSS